MKEMMKEDDAAELIAKSADTSLGVIGGDDEGHGEGDDEGDDKGDGEGSDEGDDEGARCCRNLSQNQLTLGLVSLEVNLLAMQMLFIWFGTSLRVE